MTKVKIGLQAFFMVVKRNPIKSLIVCILLIWYYFCLPFILFSSPTATVIESREGQLLGAKIATDGQWRFPEMDSVPNKFQKSVLAFEDGYFYYHPGFNPVSMFNAFKTNIKSGRVKRGGSTITQQVIRLLRGKKRRSYLEKLKELILATRLEFRMSKDKILSLYASHAPFGGNVVGLSMASYRYFGVTPDQLSWAEAATLAVLPNAPGLIFPGRNQNRLKTKRDAVLKKLLSEEQIDSTTYSLSLLEPLPGKPYRLPTMASHLTDRIAQKNRGKHITTTIDYHLQSNVNNLVKAHYNTLINNKVYNVAVLVLDLQTREVLSYVGNSPTDVFHEKDVDMIRATRSTGSLLKPFLYAASLDAGTLLPDMLVADVPTHISGYSPENFNKKFSGAVTAKRALARSLNVPAVRMLQNYGLAKFRSQLDGFKIKGINKPADYYGLTLALGGAEASLWDLCKAYAVLGSTVNHFNSSSSEYFNEAVNPILIKGEKANFGKLSTEKTLFDAGSMYLTLEAMKEVNRPQGNESWKFFDSSKQIAWKTGTSFGNKDAWAIGLTSKYVVGIWVGNADGEGRPGTTGVSTAAPLLFNVFGLLDNATWFKPPLDEFVTAEVCAKSGFLAMEACPKKEQLIPNKSVGILPCSYHSWIYTDPKDNKRVNASCFNISEAKKTAWFHLPPLMEWYYKKHQSSYHSFPSYKESCIANSDVVMEFVYPRNYSRISLTTSLDGSKNPLVLKLAHSKSKSKVFWYLDATFLGETTHFHEMEVNTKKGKHTITVVDQNGNEQKIILFIE